MPKVGIVMGSDSDMPVMSKAADILEKLGIDYEIGIPMHTTSLGGRDSLYSIVQMPSGIPVATVAINGGANAGLLAAKILATSDPELLARLKAYSQELKEQVEAKDAKLQEVGHKAYTK